MEARYDYRVVAGVTLPEEGSARQSSKFDPTLRARLRSATQPVHGCLDSLMSQLDLTRHVHYAAFLGLNAAALESLRHHWRDADSADFCAMLGALNDDLSNLGHGCRNECASVLQPIHGLGLAYVVRGSRLGSKVLRKRVAAGFPTTYLDLKLSLTWREFLADLEKDDWLPAEQDAIVSGASATFGVYDLAAHSFSVMEDE